MSAAKTLATVRRLLSGKPAVAVGVQVNVNNERAGPGQPTGAPQNQAELTKKKLPQRSYTEAELIAEAEKENMPQ